MKFMEFIMGLINKILNLFKKQDESVEEEYKPITHFEGIEIDDKFIKKKIAVLIFNRSAMDIGYDLTIYKTIINHYDIMLYDVDTLYDVSSIDELKIYEKVILIVAYDNYKIEKAAAENKFHKLISIFTSKNYHDEDNTYNFKYPTIVLTQKQVEEIPTKKVQDDILTLQNKNKFPKITIKYTYLNCIEYPEEYVDLNIAPPFNDFIKLLYVLGLKYGFILAILQYLDFNYDIYDNNYIFRYNKNKLYDIAEYIGQQFKNIDANDDDINVFLHNMKVDLFSWKSKPTDFQAYKQYPTIQHVFVDNMNKYGCQIVAHVLAKNIAVVLHSDLPKDTLHEFYRYVYQTIINFDLQLDKKKYTKYLGDAKYKKFLSYCYAILKDY